MGEKEFYKRIDLTIKRAIELGMSVESIEQNALSVEQEAHMKHILAVRRATVCAIVKVDGFTFMAYNDPRFTPKVAYLQWTAKGWATPGDVAWSSIKKANLKLS